MGPACRVECKSAISHPPGGFEAAAARCRCTFEQAWKCRILAAADPVLLAVARRGAPGIAHAGHGCHVPGVMKSCQLAHARPRAFQVASTVQPAQVAAQVFHQAGAWNGEGVVAAIGGVAVDVATQEPVLRWRGQPVQAPGARFARSAPPSGPLSSTARGCAARDVARRRRWGHARASRMIASTPVNPSASRLSRVG